MRKKVVFITGAGHCGSTLISLMLASHPDCFALGELNSYPTHYRDNLPLCEICRGECVFWNYQFNSTEAQQLAAVLGNTRLQKYVPLKLEKTLRTIARQDHIFNPYSLIFSKLNQNILLDSSKNVDWVEQRLKARELQEGIIDSYILHMVRDGREIMSSYLRRFKSMTAEKFAESWKENTLGKLKLVETFPENQRMLVHYEELALNSESVLRKLCEWLEIDYYPNMIDYWNSDHHIISGNSGVRSLIWQARQEAIDEEVTKYQGSYYQKQGLSIKIDLRWKNELTSEQIAIFEQIAGDFNKPYEWS